MASYDVVIVGSGHGGAQTAIALREAQFEGSIGIISKDSVLPYERPPLSKEYLSGEKPLERILFRPETHWSTQDISIALSSDVISINCKRKRVRTANGQTIGYGTLVWAAGGTARKLTCRGAAACGVHTVRDKADVDAIAAQLSDGARRVVVIGGGFIGLEAAAVLRKLGCDVALVEAQDRLLSRTSGADLSRFLADEHRAQGVALHLGSSLDRIVETDGKVRGVRLSSGEDLPTDMVIVGIGITPSILPLVDAGAEVGNGVVVDSQCRTSLPDIYAVGDCALHRNAFAGDAYIRLESVQNAHDMAKVAASAICGAEAKYHATPWFWSNQYDISLQTVGLTMGFDQAILRGNPKDRSFSIVYLKNDRIIALDCINKPRDYVQGRKLVEAGLCPAIDRIAAPDVPLKSLL